MALLCATLCSENNSCLSFESLSNGRTCFPDVWLPANVNYGSIWRRPESSIFEEDAKRTCVHNAPISTKTLDFLHQRLQLPLRFAYAITIHKVQGQTMRPVVVDLSKNDMEDVTTFVTLSRVEFITDLVVIPGSLDFSNETKLTITKQEKLHKEDRALKIVRNC